MYKPLSTRYDILALIKKVSVPIFLLLYIGFYYSDYLAYIKVGYLFLGIGGLSAIVYNRQILHLDIFAIMLLFLLYSFISIVWSKSQTVATSSVILLGKSIFIAFLFSQMIKTFDDFRWAMFWLFISGLIYSLLYLKQVPLAMLGDGRISEVMDDPLMPNVNIVAMLASFSFVYFICNYIIEGKRFNALLGIIAAVVVVFLGSRKSIIVIVLSSILLILKLNFKSKLKIGVLILLVVLFVLMIVPSDYLWFITERFEQFGMSSEFMDQADQERVSLFHSGIDYILQSPLVGHGFYNFSIVNGQATGAYIYSHNNFIETLVGGGLFAFIIYYSLYVKMFKNIYNSMHQLNYAFIIMILILILLFNQIAIVVLLDKYVWLLMTLLLIGSSFYKKNKSLL